MSFDDRFQRITSVRKNVIVIITKYFLIIASQFLTLYKIMVMIFFSPDITLCLMSCTFLTCWKMLDLWVHVLTRVTGRVDCFGCVCTDSKIKYSVFYDTCVLQDSRFKIILLCHQRNSRLLYYLIREIKTWLNNNHRVFVSNTYCIFQNSKNLCSCIILYYFTGIFYAVVALI